MLFSWIFTQNSSIVEIVTCDNASAHPHYYCKLLLVAVVCYAVFEIRIVQYIIIIVTATPYLSVCNVWSLYT